MQVHFIIFIIRFVPTSFGYNIIAEKAFKASYLIF